MSGILYGGFAGVLKATKHPAVLALTTGAQFSTFGTTVDSMYTIPTIAPSWSSLKATL